MFLTLPVSLIIPWKFNEQRDLTFPPVHVSNEALKERCHQLLEGIMQEHSSRGEIPPFTYEQVRKMLEKARHIGLDSLPRAAQHFGRREAVEATDTEPQTGTATTTSEDEAAGPSSDGSDAVTPNTETASAETNGSSTPENTVPMIPKTTATSQRSPAPIALPHTQQIVLQKSSDVLLNNNGNPFSVSIWFTQKGPPQATDQAAVARVKVEAPSTFKVMIEDVCEWNPSNLMP